MDNLIFPYKFRARPISGEEAVSQLRAALPEGIADSAHVFQVEGSNVNLDAYYTHMTRKTLTNFAKDAAAGVQFLDGHNNRTLGYGRSFGGRVKVDSERQPLFELPDGAELATAPPTQYAYFQGDIYTVPGIRFGGGLTYASTDDFIRALDAGLAADVSVGFSGGSWRCDICGGNYRNYGECSHFAGNVYPVGERQILATVAIDGAHLHEVSAVYDGATPNASIIKARSAAEDGHLAIAEKRILEVRYQVDLPTGRLFPAAPTPAQAGAAREQANGRSPANHEEQDMDFERIVNDVRGALAETGADETLEVHEQVRWLASELTRLRPLADDGRQYRQDLITDALAEGVRATGESFSQETYRALLENSSLDAIKQLRSDWTAIAARRWPAGRQTQEGSETQPVERPSVIPNEAYAA